MMISKGRWQGQYTYNNKAHQASIGAEATKFAIDITSIDRGHFGGTVQDDLATGGTEGIGEITGTINGIEIKFVKQMPVMTIRTLKDGSRKTFNKKHRKIYYTGILSNDGKTVSGEWKFKPGFTFVGLMLIIGVGNKGTWTMTLIE